MSDYPQFRDIADLVGTADHTASGSLTMTLDNLTPFFEPNRYATITIVTRAKWWKRPVLWLLRKPTSRKQVYMDMELGQFEIQPDGTISVPFTGKSSYPYRQGEPGT